MAAGGVGVEGEVRLFLFSGVEYRSEVLHW